MSLNCPACGTELSPVEDGGVQVDRCGGCAGVWLDGSELTKLIEARDRAFSPEVVEDLKQKLSAGRAGYQNTARASSGRMCPRCNQPLRSYNYAYSTGVIVDRCPACKGVWTDYGEIEQIEVLMSQGPEWKELKDTGRVNCPASPFEESVTEKLASYSSGDWRYGGLYSFLRWF